MPNAARFKNIAVSKQKGEAGRFKVIQGPDYGSIYVIWSMRATIGRGDESDVQIADLKASRVHAELSFEAGQWKIRDRGSANGILVNGKKVAESKLRLSDTVGIGETVLEFVPADAGSQVLAAPPRTVGQIQAGNQLLEENKKRIQAVAFSALFGRGKGDDQKGAFSNKRMLLLGLAGLGVILLVLMPENKPEQKQAVKKASPPEIVRDLSAYLPGQPSSGDMLRSAEMFFKDGFREYRAGNFTRAKTQFETVLQIAPGHSLALLYLENCQNAIMKEVQFHMNYGKKAFSAGRLREARGHYRRILRLLAREQSEDTNKIKAEAKENLDQLEKELGGSSREQRQSPLDSNSGGGEPASPAMPIPETSQSGGPQ